VPTSRLEIDLSAIQRNVGIIRQALEASGSAEGDGAARAGSAGSAEGLGSGGTGGTALAGRPRIKLCGVVKQEAYGLGAARVAKKLASLGVDALAVYCLDEAQALADLPITTPLLVLMPVRSIERHDPVYRLASRGRLHLTVHDLAQVNELAATASRLGSKVPVHVQLDTGMSRGGAMAEEATAIVQAVASNPRLQLAGVMTHFSSPNSDEAYTREQAKAFRAWIETVKPILAATPGVMIHAANTCGALRSRNLHASMVRVGQGLYGYGFESFTDPLAVEFAALGKQLQPAARWVSRIVHVHEVPKGWPVGYNRTFKASKPTRVALVPVGYADGYPLGLSNLGKVGLNGLMWDRPRVGMGESVETPKTVYAPVVGRVSMDQITIDVSGLPESVARVGAEVELIGRDAHGPNHLPAMAKAAGTITHDVLCRICPRVERVYQSRQDEDATSGTSTAGGVGGVGGAGGVMLSVQGGARPALAAG
jgi:alanine racemase